MFKLSNLRKTGMFVFILMVLAQTGFGQPRALPSYDVSSPDGNITVRFTVGRNQLATYSVNYKDTEILQPSRLGVERLDADLFTALTLDSAYAITQVNEQYTMRTGKQRNINYIANRRVFQLRNDAGNPMDIIFQVSNDGVAFRYHFSTDDRADTTTRKIIQEYTTFNFPENTTAWIQPLSPPKSGWEKSNPSYEEYYQPGKPIAELPDRPHGWVYPALFHTDGTWIILSETAIGRNYCGSRLSHVPGANLFGVEFPTVIESFPGGVAKPTSTLPWDSPWRLIAIGDLATITESTLGTDLADPAIPGDFSFVKPGRASWSWALLKDNSVNYDTQKEFIDYAANMTWEYCLVDVNWDQNIGYDRIAELSKYARKKGVGLILWYNSAGSWNTTPYTPRNKLLTHESRVKEFKRLHDMDIAGIKVDFFSGDAQSMMDYYQDIFTDAAQYDLVVNCHGTTLPRGWERTYPNLVTMEAIKGFEYVTFEQQNANQEAIQSTIIPFTRNVFDPMDYTPVSFSEIPRIHRVTTDAFELALSVIFNSGVQHFAEIPQGMAAVPSYVKKVMQHVPVAWDETKFVTGYPGKLVVLARRSGDTWYVAGINGENSEKKVALELPFLNSLRGTLITDGDNDRSFTQKSMNLASNKSYTISLRGNGGFLMKFPME